MSFSCRNAEHLLKLKNGLLCDSVLLLWKEAVIRRLVTPW